MSASRRQFLRAASGLTLAAGTAGQRFSVPFAMSMAGMASLASQSASAADSTGYKALVCLYMSGGNDAHNWIVPYDAEGYASYASVRGALALPQSSLLPITLASSQGSGRAFAMAPELAPLKNLYEQGKVAVLANVGTLMQPTTKADYDAGRGLPPKLFSHNDQASVWQSMSPEGAHSGWGGRMGDILMSANANPVFTAISANGNAVFLAGTSVSQYEVGVTGSTAIRGLTVSTQMGSSTAPLALKRILASTGSTPFQSDYTRVVQRSIDADKVLTAALATVPTPAIPQTPIPLATGGTTTLDQDPLAQQLQIVARIISANQTLGMRRQVFMVAVGGFDFHSNQLRDQPAVTSSVANAVAYFQAAIDGMGLGKNVTLFTASDFGRTLTTNGSGSDHGWGSHHLIVGGAVKGRNIYNNFPVTALGTTTDLGSGRLLPTASVSQYASTLGRWFGLSATEATAVLPGLENFSSQTLGFL